MPVSRGGVGKVFDAQATGELGDFHADIMQPVLERQGRADLQTGLPLAQLGQVDDSYLGEGIVADRHAAGSRQLLQVDQSTAFGQVEHEVLFGSEGMDVRVFADIWWITRLCDGETGADGKPIARQVVQDEFDERSPGAIYIYGSDKSDIVQEDITDEVDDSPKA